MNSIDRVPITIGILVSVVMLLGGLLLGYLTIPNLLGSSSVTSASLNAVGGASVLDTLNAPEDSVQNQSGSGAESVSELDSEQGKPTDEQLIPEDGAVDPSTSSQTAGQSGSTVVSSQAQQPQSPIVENQQAIPVQVTYSVTPPQKIQQWVHEHDFLTFVPASQVDSERPLIHIGVDRQNGIPVFKQTFAAATKFNTLESDLSLSQIKAIWRGTTGSLAVDQQPAFTNIAVLQEDVASLTALLGAASSSVEFVSSIEGLSEATKGATPTLLVVPFEKLIPSWTVLAVNKENPIENANRYRDSAYPLKAVYYLRRQGFSRADQYTLDTLISSVPATDRDPKKLTVVAMTGVTAMVRVTADQMDRYGTTWPAEVVGSELASADITHISNEVPFVEDCVTNTSSTNLLFCSKYSYMDTLQASGVDIIGLTGNHQNDYGLEDALESLDFYAEHNLPVYGGGKNREEANAPLYLEHNGNRLAFLGANSYGPPFAWATDSRPGSAQFDLNILSANIRAVKEQNLADVVFTELQYQETYHVTPLIQQRDDFNALLRAGADIVTGVQSHVPQAIEFTDGKLILYGLGNLFFDQMYRQSTREGFFVKHTIYEGRHISTQIFTTMLHDFGQPNWTTAAERESLLKRVFQASYWE